MKYSPGSFSKNFAWHGTGLRKLHAAIRSGFSSQLEPVSRLKFRRDCGLGGGIELIPINFFLHNKDRKMSVDELVFQAINHPHSLRFDRLGLFALHLSRAGDGDRVVSRPAMWANEFVREQLWSNGTWQASTLDKDSLDVFIEGRMEALPHVRLKCRTNYRYLFELCDYLPSSLPIINAGADQWIASALYLAWDRHIWDGGSGDKKALLELVKSDELYKLLGVDKDHAQKLAGELADSYINAGGINRFTGPAVVPTPEPEVVEEQGAGWLDQEESDEVVKRRAVERLEQKRDRKKAAALKKHYNNTCMFCGFRLQVSEDSFYSEAAHIKPLGKPHEGPDTMKNMLMLCPNHHLQFDRGVLRLSKDGEEYKILSIVPGDPLHGRIIVPRHELDEACVRWHRLWYRSRLT